MEDQGKRLLLTVGLVAVLYFVWMKFFAPAPPPPAPPPPPAATAPSTPGTPGPTDASAPAMPPAAGADAAAATVCDPSKETGAPVWETADYVATFSRCGGALQSFVLKGEQYRVTGTGEGAGKAHQIDLVHDNGNAATFPLQVQ